MVRLCLDLDKDIVERILNDMVIIEDKFAVPMTFSEVANCVFHFLMELEEDEIYKEELAYQEGFDDGMIAMEEAYEGSIEDEEIPLCSCYMDRPGKIIIKRYE